MKMNILRKGLAVGIILLFIGTCIIPAIAHETEKPSSTTRGQWLYVGGSGPGNYTKIQDAIDAATNGDWIYVFSGEYREALTIKKTLRLIGENQESTRIYGGICVYEDNVEIIGFTITQRSKGSSALSGIAFTYTKNCSVLSCLIHSSSAGILLYRCNYTRIIDCTIWNTSNGILLSNPDNLGNVGNIFSNNTIHDNEYGVNCEHGLSYHYLNYITRNYISNNTVGVYMIMAQENEISFNTIANNTLGCALDMCMGGGMHNLVHHNIFLNNNNQAGNGIGENYWYLNYWDNYPGIDANHDGIGDTAFEYDKIPLIKPYTDPTLPFTAVLIVPESRSLYFFDQKVCLFPMTVIVGPQAIVFDVTAPLLIDKIDLHIGFIFKASFIDRPYKYFWWIPSFFIHRIRVIAYTYDGDVSSATLFVWKIL